MEKLLSILLLFFSLSLFSEQFYWDNGFGPDAINILIIRKERVTDQGYMGCTTGNLYINGKYFCKTLERLFGDSENFISSVPSGKYNAIVRYSQTKHQWRIQLEPVMTYVYHMDDPFLIKKRVTRDGIQIHHGTRPEHSLGCILVGLKGNNPCELTQSRQIFNSLMLTCFGSIYSPNQNIKVTVTIETDYL